MQLLPLLFSFSSLFPFSGPFNKRVKNKTLIAHLRGAVEPLHSETINTSESFKKGLRFKMSDPSRPQIIEVLESSAGEMRAELSHTRAHIKKVMGMM